MTHPEPSVEGDIAHLLAEDAEIAEQGVTAVRENGAVVLRGCVNTEAVRQLIVARVSEAFPGHEIRDEMTVAAHDAPDHQEAL